MLKRLAMTRLLSPFLRRFLTGAANLVAARVHESKTLFHEKHAQLYCDPVNTVASLSCFSIRRAGCAESFVDSLFGQKTTAMGAWLVSGSRQRAGGGKRQDESHNQSCFCRRFLTETGTVSQRSDSTPRAFDGSEFARPFRRARSVEPAEGGSRKAFRVTVNWQPTTRN